MANAIAPPNTVTQLAHAVTIRVNGQTIGAISEWNPRMTRQVTEIYELGDGSTGGYSPGIGVPFEKVPGNVSGLQMDVRRFDIYSIQFEQAFQTGIDLTMLSSQTDPFTCRESWLSANNTNNYFNLYIGCWFSDLGRNISSTGERTINVNAVLQYTRKERGAA